MAKKTNLFESAVQAREQEQAKVTAVVTGTAPEKEEKRKFTLSIPLDKIKKVKRYAVDNDTTVSDLFSEWIDEKCGE